MTTTLTAVRMTRWLRLFAVLMAAAAVFSVSACGSDASEEAKIEDFPNLLLGTWEQIGGPVGTLTFTGTDFSGIGRLSADGIQAETFTFLWVAPAIIRTDQNNDQSFSVLFEDGGGTLVLATVAGTEDDEVIRYRRLR